MADEIFSEAVSVSLSRRAFFSAGLRLARHDWDDAGNRAVFGRDVGPHGHEYEVEVSWSGPVSPEDGMIVNLMAIKPLLSQSIAPLENCFLNDDVEYFQSVVPTVENVAFYLWQTLPGQVENASLQRLRLRQSRRAQVEIQSRVRHDKSASHAIGSHTVAPHTMKIARSYEFAAAHRLFLPTLNEDENLARFDKCSNRAGHGHNFQLDVWIEGAPDAHSGFIVNPGQLDDWVEQEVYARFDHKHLNEDCPEFSQHDLVPTSENLALVIFHLLKRRLEKEGYHLARVGLRETQKNYFEVETDVL